MERWVLLSCLVFWSFSLSLARAPIASGVCPKGYFRNVTVLFPCDQNSGVAYAPVSKSEDFTVRVPTGVQDLKILVTASFAMMITFNDPIEQKEIPFVQDAEKTEAWRGLTLQLYAGQVTSDKTSIWEGSWRVGLNYVGTSQSELDVIVRGVPVGGRHELVNISYSYGAFHGCTKPFVPMGCGDFSRFASRQLVFNWSSWVQEKYPIADEAWRDLCDKRMEEVIPLTAGPVPYYMFGEVWAKWPLANLVHPGWREAFRFIDTLGGTPPDGYVEPIEFRTAYGLASTYLSMFGWCEMLRKQYGTSQEAWKALSGAEFGFQSPVDFEKWKTSFWNTYSPEAGMSKAEADESFVYADADGNEEVSEKEFASIYFSCAPENQGKPPGGQAAEAEKKEESAAVAKAEQQATVPGETVARCLYENIEYSGTLAGTASRTMNLTECQVNCRNTVGCAHFTFYPKDGSCKMYGLDAIWLTTEGAMSGPARCVAQVRLTLEDLGDMTNLEDERQVLQVEIAMELAKSSSIPIHDIRDMQGQVGKVTMTKDQTVSGKLILDSFIDMPAGSELQDIEKIAAQSDANRKLRGALQADTASAEAKMQVLVAAIPFAQCFVLGTKLAPEMTDQVTALTARACQTMCERTEGCTYFSYFKGSQQCSLHASSARPIFFESAMAGPKRCQGLPSVYEPSADEMEAAVAGEGGGIFTNPWFWIAVILVLAALVTAYLLLRRCRFTRRSKERQVSRQGVDRKLGGHRYMPLPADQQLEQDMISQAASDAAWHQIASQPSKAPTSDASPMSGRGTWKSGCGGQQGSWQLHQLPPTPRSVPMVSPGPQGQCQGGCGGCGGCGPGGPGGPAGPGWGGQPQWLQPPSETQDQPNWMPHFLGAEAVREYDTWRTQRPEFSSWHAQEMRPMFPTPTQSYSEFPHAASLPAQAGWPMGYSNFSSPPPSSQLRSPRIT